MKTIIILLVCGIAVLTPACQTPDTVRTYRPPGEHKQLLLEVRKNEGSPIHYELQIDGTFVFEMPATGYQSRASGYHKGRRVEMLGSLVRGNRFVVEVFVDGSIAATFEFSV